MMPPTQAATFTPRKRSSPSRCARTDATDAATDTGAGALGGADAGGGTVLVHIDAYRIRSPHDLASIGWDELMASGESVVAVEWPSRIAPALPDHRVEVRIRHAGEDVREIEIEDIRPSSRATHCATCGTALPAGGDARFCSDRCRMGDLGRWFRGDYAIGRPIEEDDLHGDAWQPGGPGGRDR